jgi:hypothetical protein
MPGCASSTQIFETDQMRGEERVRLPHWTQLSMMGSNIATIEVVVNSRARRRNGRYIIWISSRRDRSRLLPIIRVARVRRLFIVRILPLNLVDQSPVYCGSSSKNYQVRLRVTLSFSSELRKLFIFFQSLLVPYLPQS